jgi:hypothetical protein
MLESYGYRMRHTPQNHSFFGASTNTIFGQRNRVLLLEGRLLDNSDSAQVGDDNGANESESSFGHQRQEQWTTDIWLNDATQIQCDAKQDANSLCPT